MSIKLFLRDNLTLLRAFKRLKHYLHVRFVKPLQRKRYGYISPTASVEVPVYLTNQANVYLEDYARIRAGFKLVNTTGKLIVKRDAGISLNCMVVTGNHRRAVGIPLGIGNGNHINDIERDIIIGEEAWIGVNVTLLSGAKIGRGAIIGACSMVNTEIPPYAVAVGSPAKIIASTFTIEQIIEHEKKLYAPQERFSREELEELFKDHYIGKRSVGIDSTLEEKKVSELMYKTGRHTY